MPIHLFAILTGILLGVVGIVGFVTTGMTHYTALIPFALGDAMMMCGILTVVRPTWKKHTMHAAATIAVVGLLGGNFSWGKLKDAGVKLKDSGPPEPAPAPRLVPKDEGQKPGNVKPTDPEKSAIKQQPAA